MFVQCIAGSCDLTVQSYRDAVARLAIAVAIGRVSARNHEGQWRLYASPITGYSSMLLSIFERTSIARTGKCRATKKNVSIYANGGAATSLRFDLDCATCHENNV